MPCYQKVIVYFFGQGRTMIFFEVPWSIIWLPLRMNIVIIQYDTTSWDCIKMESL